MKLQQVPHPTHHLIGGGCRRQSHIEAALPPLTVHLEGRINAGLCFSLTHGSLQQNQRDPFSRRVKQRLHFFLKSPHPCFRNVWPDVRKPCAELPLRIRQTAELQKLPCTLFHAPLRIRLRHPFFCSGKAVAGRDPVGKNHQPQQQGPHRTLVQLVHCRHPKVFCPEKPLAQFALQFLLLLVPKRFLCVSLDASLPLVVRRKNRCIKPLFPPVLRLCPNAMAQTVARRLLMADRPFVEILRPQPGRLHLPPHLRPAALKLRLHLSDVVE